MKILHNLKMRAGYAFVLFLLMNLSSEAQIESSPVLTDGQQNSTICHQSYNVVQSKRYDIPSSSFDIMSSSQLYSHRNLSKSYEEHFDFDQNGNMTYTILHGESTNYYEDWMTKPVMTVFTRESILIKREKPNSWGESQTLRPNSELEMTTFDTIAASTYTMNNNIVEVPTVEDLLEIGATENTEGEYFIDVEGQIGTFHYKPGSYLWTFTDIQDIDCTKKITRIYGPVDGMHGRFALFYEKVEQPEMAYDEFPITRIDESVYSNWAIEDCQDGGIQPRALKSLTEFKLYPNPVTHQLFVDLPSDWINAEVKVFDHQGVSHNCSFIKNNDLQITVDTKSLIEGMYYLKLVNAEQTKTLKFVKSY